MVLLIARTLPRRFQKKFGEAFSWGREEDELTAPGPRARLRRASLTTAKLKDNRAVISSHLGGESRVSFALFSASKARKYESLASRAASGLARFQRKWVETQPDHHKIKGRPCGDF